MELDLALPAAPLIAKFALGYLAALALAALLVTPLLHAR